MARITADELDDLIAEALDEIPERFHRYLENIVVTSEEEPTPEEVRSMGLSRRQTLLGVYRGVPLIEREANFGGLPDHIVIFRGPIRRACATRRQVIEQVRETVLHEIGHHFGLSDAEM